MNNTVLSLLLFAVAYAEWLVFGLKGSAMLIRSPSVILWVVAEVVLGALAGFGLYETFSAKSLTGAVLIITSTAAGAALGVGTSGLVDWKKWRSHE